MTFWNIVSYRFLLLYCLYSQSVSRANARLVIDEEEYVRVLVGFHDRQERESYARRQRRQLRTASGKPKAKIVYEFQHTEAVAMQVTRSELEGMKNDGTFRYIEEDFEVPVAEKEAVEDTFEHTSYAIGLTQANRTFTTDPTWDRQCAVYLCVVDSGVELNHADIPYSKGDIYVNGTSIGPAEGQDWANPVGTSHGTQVASIMIAQGGNGRGIVGVIPQGPERSNVCLRVAKVIPDRSFNTRVSALLEASEWCTEQAGDKPLVINLSFAVRGQTTSEKAIYQSLYDQGALIVASAGNFGSSYRTYPGGHDTVISVGSVNADLRRSWFSQFNTDIELVAPGENIPVLNIGGKPVHYSGGTSMACPFVAGLAARIWTGVPRCNNTELRQALRDTARRLGPGYPNREYGYGLIQARSARDLLVNSGCNDLANNDNSTEAPPPNNFTNDNSTEVPPPNNYTNDNVTNDNSTEVPPPNNGTNDNSTEVPPPNNFTRTPLLSDDEVLEVNLMRFRDLLQSRGPQFVDCPDDIRITAQDWLIRDPQLLSYSDDRLIQRWVLAVFAYGFQQVSNPQALLNWVNYKHECSWFHTVGEDGRNELCNSDGLYLRLDLRQQNLVGTLPSELALMSNHLRMIHLFDNLIYGTVPTELGLLSTLQRLELTQNSFTEELPSEIGSLDRLTFLGLGRNSFRGPLPTELGKLTNLDTFGIEWNLFQGQIPSEIGNARKLMILNMDMNSFAGTIPQSFGELSNLQFLNLIQNDELSGSIPDALCALNMTYLGADCQYVDCPCCTFCHEYR